MYVLFLLLGTINDIERTVRTKYIVFMKSYIEIRVLVYVWVI